MKSFNSITLIGRLTKLLNTTLGTGTLELFTRFYHESYKVTDFPDTQTIEIESATDKKAYFLDDDYILLFKKQRAGYKDQSLEGSDTVNCLRLQLNAKASYAWTTITLKNDGSNAVGADTLNYFVIPESVALQYVAGSKTASAFTDLVPAELLIQGNNQVIFEDNFNRANENPISGNDWTSIKDIGVLDSRKLVSNELQFASVSNNASGYRVYRNTEDYQKENYEITCKFMFNPSVSGGGGKASRMGIVTGSSNSTITTNYNVWTHYGITVNFVFYDTNVLTNEIQIFDANTERIAGAFVFTIDTYYNCRIQKRGRNIKVRVWDASTAEPSSWNINYTNTADFTLSGNYGQIYAYQGDSSGHTWITHVDDYRYSDISDGYTLKYKAESLTDVDKIETITSLKRSDTSNQNPIIYETGAIIY